MSRVMLMNKYLQAGGFKTEVLEAGLDLIERLTKATWGVAYPQIGYFLKALEIPEPWEKATSLLTPHQTAVRREYLRNYYQQYRNDPNNRIDVPCVIGGHMFTVARGKTRKDDMHICVDCIKLPGARFAARLMREGSFPQVVSLVEKYRKRSA